MSDSGTRGTVDPRRYREILGHFATGVTVVTTISTGPVAGAADGVDLDGQRADTAEVHPWGTTVNAFSSVSLDPPLVLICIAHVRSIHPVIASSGRFAVNILGEDDQLLSDCFAGAPSPYPRSAFCGASYHLGTTGVPILDSAIAYLDCELERSVDVGDHTIYVGRVVGLGSGVDHILPLLYYRGRYLRIERAEERDLLGKPEL